MRPASRSDRQDLYRYCQLPIIARVTSHHAIGLAAVQDVRENSLKRGLHRIVWLGLRQVDITVSR